MNKTFEQVSNAKHHFFIDEILLAGLINWNEKLCYPIPSPLPFCKFQGLIRSRLIQVLFTPSAFLYVFSFILVVLLVNFFIITLIL